MKRKNSMLVTLFVLVIATLACNLPTRATERVAGSEPIPLPEETITPGEVQETEEALDEDLVNAALASSDLPDDFTALNETQMREYGISVDVLANTFTGVLSEARPQNYTAFHKPGLTNPQIVVSTVLAPLTAVERIAFDVYMSSPEMVATEFADGAGAEEVNLIPGARQIGDSAVGLSFLSDMSGVMMRSDAVIARRDQTVQVVMISYPDGGTPEVAAVDIARIMDQKIDEALR